MGDIFGAVGSIAGAAMSASATKKATEAQIQALERQKEFVYSELSPSKIAGQAQAQDVQRAKDRLALQGITDPATLAARYQAEQAILGQAAGIGQGDAAGIAQIAAQEAARGVPGLDLAKKQLVDAALQELSLGATLPPDIQAEIVKAGLERSGMTTGSASPKGFGGQILRTKIGAEAEKLKAERQARAVGLTQAASALETQRQQILGTLFPNLNQVQLQDLQAQQGVLSQANQMVPEAGLGGTDVANIWLARVGATNQLSQSAADAAARGAMGQAQAWQTGIGAATSYAAQAAPSFGSLFGGGSSRQQAAPTPFQSNPTSFYANDF